MDELDQAIHDTVREFPGGGVALAGKVGMVAGTLLNKANPGQDAQLTLRESVPLQLVAKDFRILFSYAAVLNHFPPIPFADFSDTSNADLIELITRFHADIGKADEAVHKALSDKRITKADVDRVRKRFLEAQQAGHEFLARLEALCAQEAHRASH